MVVRSMSHKFLLSLDTRTTFSHGPSSNEPLFFAILSITEPHFFAQLSINEPHFPDAAHPPRVIGGQKSTISYSTPPNCSKHSSNEPHFYPQRGRLLSHNLQAHSTNEPHIVEQRATFYSGAFEYRATFLRLTSHVFPSNPSELIWNPARNYLTNCLSKRTKQEQCCSGGFIS